MSEYKYSNSAGGKVKHINANSGIVTICGLETERLYSAMIYDKQINLPVCKKCLRGLKLL